MSSGAKIGIGAGVGGGVGALLIAGLAFWWWRRRKGRVGDDFKWPDLGDGTGSGGTTAGLYPNPTHPTGNNRFDMDDDELFDGEGTTAVGHGGSSANGSKMMSERDPSFLSSAAGTAGGGAGYAGGYPGAAGGGGAAAAAAGMAGFGAAGAVAAHQAHRSQGGGGNNGYDGSDYYGSQDGNHQSPPGSQFSHGGQQAYGGQQQQPYGNYGGYDPNAGYYGGGPGGGAAPAAGAAAAGMGAGAASAGLGRTGSIASTAARNYQVEAIPGGHAGPMYGDNESNIGGDDYGMDHDNDGYYQNGNQGQHQGFQDRPRNRNRLSVVNNLGDVGEED